MLPGTVRIPMSIRRPMYFNPHLHEIACLPRAYGHRQLPVYSGSELASLVRSAIAYDTTYRNMFQPRNATHLLMEPPSYIEPCSLSFHTGILLSLDHESVASMTVDDDAVYINCSMLTASGYTHRDCVLQVAYSARVLSAYPLHSTLTIRSSYLANDNSSVAMWNNYLQMADILLYSGEYKAGAYEIAQGIEQNAQKRISANFRSAMRSIHTNWLRFA